MASANFTAAYDLIVARIATLLPTHLRLPDAYDLDQNPDQYLAKGWGLAVGPGGVNTQRFTGNKRSTEITFRLSITRKVYALDLDPVKKSSAEKDLLEDMRAIIDDIWLNYLGITGSPLVRFADFEGISPVRVDKKSFLSVSINIRVEYIVV
jgi:hypothetical protein